MIILAHSNENFNDLQGAYLFAKIRKEQETYKANYPDADIISLGIGDVTQPLVPAVVEAMSCCGNGRSGNFPWLRSGTRIFIFA